MTRKWLYEVQIKRMQQVSKVCSQTYSPLDKRQLVYGFVKAEASELHFLNKRQILWLNVLNGRNDLKYLLLPVLLLQNFPVASKVVVNGRRSTFLRILSYEVVMTGAISKLKLACRIHDRTVSWFVGSTRISNPSK
ncbi:hypothetical protein D918_04590 [Trichuris suis]|nr:hypothetical protein D918_04590 [Trichuris suis]